MNTFLLFVPFSLYTSFVSVLLRGPPSFPGVKGVRVVLGPARTCGCFLQTTKVGRYIMDGTQTEMKLERKT